jgi:hypothetical protein
MISDLLSTTLAEQASASSLEAALAREAAEAAPAEQVHDLAELLEGYLNSVPPALDSLTAMSKDPRFGRSVAFVTGQVLIYLFDEDDLFSEADLGALGLLDDAYLAHGCLAALLSTFPELSPPDGYAPPDDRTLAAVRSLLPAGVAAALDRTSRNLVGIAAGLYAGAGNGSSDQQPRPSLRVGDALAELKNNAAR